MIRITLYKHAITCEGHANYDTKGHDIYCAGVSAIIMSAMNWFKKTDLDYVVEDGLIKVKLANLTQDNLYKLELLKTQLKSFTQEDMQPYIEIKESGKDHYE